MKVAVFGAGGWLGRAIVDNLDARHEVRAIDHSTETWAAWDDVDGIYAGEQLTGDIVDFSTTDHFIDGVDAVVHASAYFGQDDDDPLPWMVNLKGLWNVLESSRRRGIRRVVHIGSCETVHPAGHFFDTEQRRPGGGIYPITKRLQEEMCRSFWDAWGSRIIVLRPDYIVDTRIGLGRFREKLGPPEHPTRNGWVCRHDLAEACRLALENETIDFDIFHIVGTPEADATCNVPRSREVLGLTYKGNLEHYR